jgi:hypothetical protein
MIKTILSLLPIFIMGFPGTIPTDDYKFGGETHLTNIRMLTEEGENAEAYLSFDEKKLTYQSAHGDIKCDQIFTMNIDGSDKRMVSTGMGKTTCAYFLPRIAIARNHRISQKAMFGNCTIHSTFFLQKLMDQI